MRAAPTSSTRERATSKTTSALRVRCRWALALVRALPSRREAFRSGREICKAGTSPNRTPVKTDTAAANARMRPSNKPSRLRCSTGRRGSSAGATANRPWRPMAPRKTPATPPATASSRLSVSNCRRITPRLAPSAMRRAISLVRPAARGQQKVGDVGAGDQQDEADSAQEDEQGRTKVAVEGRAQRLRDKAFIRRHDARIEFTEADR